MQELKELQRQGMSIPGHQRADRLGPQDHSQVCAGGGGWCREYGPRPAQPSKLDAFKPYLEERLRAGSAGMRGCCCENCASGTMQEATRF